MGLTDYRCIWTSILVGNFICCFKSCASLFRWGSLVEIIIFEVESLPLWMAFKVHLHYVQTCLNQFWSQRLSLFLSFLVRRHRQMQTGQVDSNKCCSLLTKGKFELNRRHYILNEGLQNKSVFDVLKALHIFYVWL